MMAILARSEYCSLRCRVSDERAVGLGGPELEARLSDGEACLETSIRGIQSGLGRIN